MEISKILDKIKFSVFSPDMIRKMSATRILVPDTYDDDGYPIDGGLVDTKLGVVDPGLRCKTCGGRVKECPGHFGHIELVRPIIHVEFAKHIHLVLKSTCPNCHHLIGKKAQVVELDTLELESEVDDTKVRTGMDWEKLGTVFWLGNDLMWIQDMILRDASPKRRLQGLRHARQYSGDIDFGEKSFPCQELDLLISQVESIEGLRDYSMYRNLYDHILSRIEAIKWYFTAKAQEKQPGFEKLRAL